jgi:hypothetical protein
MRAYGACMEGNAGTRTEPGRGHPETNICRVEGIWRAWVPDGRCQCACCGAYAHAGTEDELLAKLAE